jgi:hypothetical protein
MRLRRHYLTGERAESAAPGADGRFWERPSSARHFQATPDEIEHLRRNWTVRPSAWP